MRGEQKVSTAEYTIISHNSISVEITKPREGYLYIFDREIFPIGLTIIVGKITLEASVSSDYYVERVDFYIDEQLKKSDYVEPYTCLLEDTLSFLHTIKVEAFDLNGTKAEDEVKTLIFNVRTNELLNEDEASQILIEEVIKPDELLYDIIAFTTHKILYPGDVISSGVNNYTIDSPTWFFWVDDYPYFDFAHSTRYVFIDAKDGEINITHEDFPPWINGEFLVNNDFNKSKWVFSTFYGLPPQYNISQEMDITVCDDCGGNRHAIMYKGAPGEIRKANCEAIEKVLKNNGFNTQFIDMDFQRFRNALEDLKNNLKSGDELIIYLDSHGEQYKRVNGRPVPKPPTKDCKDVYIVMEYMRRGGRWRVSKALTDRGFKTLLTGFKEGVKIKVIIRCCYSGGFIDDLKEVKNVKVILTSTDHNSKSFRPDLKTIKAPKSRKFPEWNKMDGWLRKNKKKDQWEKDNDKRTEREDLSEYTGGVVTGLKEKLGAYIKNKITQEKLFEHVHKRVLDLDEWYKNRKLIEQYWQHLKKEGKNPGGWGANNWAEEPQKYPEDKPKVKINKPKDGETKKDKNCSLSGYATDDVGVIEVGYIHEAEGYHYEYNETLEMSVQNYSFNWTIELIEGWNKLTVYAMDGAGNVGNDSVTVYYYQDTEPPTVIITWPEDGYESEVANITVEGYANDVSGIAKLRFQQIAEDYYYEYNLTFETPSQNHSFDWELELIEGWNKLTVYAEDTVGNEGNDSIIVYYYPGNHPPNQPTMPEGPTEGEVGESLYFASHFTDPDGDSMEIMFDWGDGTKTGWIGPVANDTTVGNYHTYSSPGTYEVRTKARDIPYMAESEWSEPWSVTIS